MKAKKMVQSVREQVLKDEEYLKGLLAEIETEIKAAVVTQEEFQEEFQKESSSSETDKN
jgi:hypothetical protein